MVHTEYYHSIVKMLYWTTVSSKGPRYDLTQNSEFYVFIFLMPRVVNMGNVIGSSKFEGKILSYKQTTEFEILCFINKFFVL